MSVKNLLQDLCFALCPDAWHFLQVFINDNLYQCRFQSLMVALVEIIFFAASKRELGRQALHFLAKKLYGRMQ